MFSLERCLLPKKGLLYLKEVIRTPLVSYFQRPKLKRQSVIRSTKLWLGFEGAFYKISVRPKTFSSEVRKGCFLDLLAGYKYYIPQDMAKSDPIPSTRMSDWCCSGGKRCSSPLDRIRRRFLSNQSCKRGKMSSLLLSSLHFLCPKIFRAQGFWETA